MQGRELFTPAEHELFFSHTHQEKRIKVTYSGPDALFCIGNRLPDGEDL
jgi:hypothetical protein